MPCAACSFRQMCCPRDAAAAGYAQLVALLQVNSTLLALSHSGNRPPAGCAEKLKELLMVLVVAA